MSRVPKIWSLHEFKAATNHHHTLLLEAQGRSQGDPEVGCGLVRFDYAALFEAPALNGLPAPVDHIMQLPGWNAIRRHTLVVVWVGNDIQKACRVLWTLDYVGFKGERALLFSPSLEAASAAVATTPSSAAVAWDWQPHQNEQVWCSAAWLSQHLHEPSMRLLDVRSEAEFFGLTKRGARSGHIPGAIHFPFQQLMKPQQAFLTPHETRQKLQEVGVRTDDPLVCYCHTHQRSAHTYVALTLAGHSKVKAYAGSWGEWSALTDYPIASF